MCKDSNDTIAREPYLSTLVERTFLMTVPRANPQEPKPLLFAFHGYGDSALEIASEHKFDEMAQQKGFVVVYPDGRKN